MENRILIRKSDVSGNYPTVSALSAGEIALNFKDGYMFFKKDSGNDEYISKFLDIDNLSHLLNISLSSFTFQYGNNTTSEIFGSVLCGYNNDVSGAASTVINGEDNDISGDFSIIGNGINNKIEIDGDYSFIAAGYGNLVNHPNVFVLGTGLSSHASDFTYVNNLSATGEIYCDTVSAKYFKGTLIDWMALVKGYKTPPTLLTTLGTGEVFTYVYATTGSDITYYRYVASNGSEDSFYRNFSNSTLSNLVATRAIIL